MLTINDKTYRNLEEQVQKNMCDIKALMFGLKVVGQVANVPDLPSDIKVGETILVGTDRPYYFYMKIGEPKNYLNLGTLESTIPGPKGEPGEKGEPGKRGSHWKVGPTAPTINGDEQEGDLYLNVLNGNVYAFKNDKWTLYGTIKGPQGAIGPQGDIGPEGAQGAIGPVGPQGSSGISYRIIDILDLISELPLPSTAQPNDAYLVKEGAPTQDSQNMYILVKGLWTNIGPTHLDQEAINELYMILADNYDDLNGQILVVKNDIETKTNHNMLNWGFGPEATTKKEFYSKVGQVFVNKPTQSIYMYGEPEQLNAHFFDIWGKPEGFKATHAFVSIRPLSNEHSRVSFKMYLNSSNYGTTYEMTVSGYAGTYVGDSGWYNITKISEEFKSQYDFLYSEIGRVDGRIDSNELWINEHTKAIQTHGKQIKNLNENVANIYDLIGATTIQEVEEDFTGNVVPVPATVQVGNQPQTVVTPQKFKISRIKGSTKVVDGALVSANIKDITAVGTNRIPFPYKDTYKALNGLTFKVNSDGSIHITGTATKTTYFDLMAEGTKLNIIGDIFLSGCPSGGSEERYYMQFRTANEYLLDVGNGVAKTITNDVISYAQVVILPTLNPLNIIFKPMLNVGSSALPHRPYLATSTKQVDITLKGVGEVGDEAILTNTPDTELYEVDVVRRMGEVDLGNYNWQYSSVDKRFFAEALKGKIKLSTIGYCFNIICPLYETKATPIIENPSPTNDKAIIYYQDSFYVRDSKYIDAVAFKEAMKGVKLVYELETPEEPVQVAKDLTLDDVSVTGQYAGEITANSTNTVQAAGMSMKFNIKYHEEA